MRYAILRSNAAGSVLLTLVCTSETDSTEVDSLALAMLEHPQVIGVLRCDNDLDSGTLLTDSIRSVCGASTLEEQLFAKPFELGPLSFWQVHRSQAELAYRAIADAIPKVEDGIVLELYAGTGGIAFALADAGHQVLGVDNNEEAVHAANQAAAERGLSERLRFACADATRLGADYFMKVCAVVVDPPRKGLGQRGVQQLAQSLPPRIAYLSCGPESLARDLRELAKVGYRIESIQAFDFMPGTAQVECLAVLARS
jgi:23S rRNA (uracil1939-C5)-methyltransferase